MRGESAGRVLPPASRWLLFTDLDGTLLDHHDYSHAAADASLARLQAAGVPCILCSSKTRREILSLRSELGNDAPFIVENGTGIFLPPGPAFDCRGLTQGEDGLYRHSLGRRRDELLACLQEPELRRYAWRGFAQMDAAEIASHTGLSLEGARDAAWREFCEPLIWLDGDDKLGEFADALQARGLRCLRGGRFLHVMDNQAGKDRAMAWLRARAAERDICLALGDSDNDREMLDAADIAVLVRSPVRDFPAARGRSLTLRTQGYGPLGWAEAVDQLLDQQPGP